MALATRCLENVFGKRGRGKKRYLSKSDEGAVGCWGLWMLGFKKDQGVSLAV